MQALQNRMLAATGDARVAADAMRFVREEANRLGLDFAASAEGFSGFAASALRAGLTLDETKGIFVGVSEAAAALQISGERVQLVFSALSQMASKGSVSMEELRQQLGDSLPGALQIFAKAMGVSVPEFMKMIEAGKVLTPDLRKLGDELHRQFGERAVAAANSAQAGMNRLKNSVRELLVQVANSGAMDKYNQSIVFLNNAVNDPSLRSGLAQLANGVASLTQMFAVGAVTIAGWTAKLYEAMAAKVEAAGNWAFGAMFGEEGRAAIEAARGKAAAARQSASVPASAALGSFSLGTVQSPIMSAASEKASSARSSLRGRVDSMRAGLIDEGNPDDVGHAKSLATIEKRYEEEQQLLEKALKEKAITQQEFNEASLEVENDYQSRLGELRKQYRDQYLSDEQVAAEAFLGIKMDAGDKSLREQGESFRQSISQAAQHNKTFFMLEKAAAIARALISARQSVVDAYAFGTKIGGPPLGAMFAGVAAAAQAANIAAIAGTSFGGGDSGGSVDSGGGSSAGDASASTAPAGGPGTTQSKNVFITIEGEYFGAEQARTLVNKLNEFIGDGSIKLNVTGAAYA